MWRLGIFRNALISAYRHLARHPGYAVLNILGLGIGVAAYLLISAYVQFQRSFDVWIPESDRMYLATTQLQFPGVTHEVMPGSMLGLADLLHEDYPDLKVVRLQEQSIGVRQGGEIFPEQISLVDGDFLDVFALRLTAGDRRTALSAPNGVLISEKMARKYFAGRAPVGQTMTLSGKNGAQTFNVVGVIETRPQHSTFKLDFVRAFSAAERPTDGTWRLWGQVGGYTVLKAPGRAAIDRLNGAMDTFVDRKAQGFFGPTAASSLVRIRFAPVRDAQVLDASIRSLLSILSVIGGLALAVATINYVNLATARAGLRAREVAVRKVLGARLSTLRLQFLTESVVLTLMAAVLGVGLALLARPILASEGSGMDLDLASSWPNICGLLAVVVAAGLLAGVYPALVIAGFRPGAVLGASREASGGRMALRLREGLVILQFVVVIALALVLTGFWQQVERMKTLDLGFNKSQLLLVTSSYSDGLSQAQRLSVWNVLRTVPGVVTVAAGDQGPGDDHLTAAVSVIPPGFQGTPDQAPSLYMAITGPDYFPTYRATLLAGRWLSATYGADQLPKARPDPSLTTNVMISASAARSLGEADPARAVGRVFRIGSPAGPAIKVVGVVRDMRFRAPMGGANRMLFFFDPEPSNAPLTVVRYSGSESQMRAALASAWRQVAPDVPFTAVSANENLDKAYRPFTNVIRMVGLGAAVAGALGAVGLYGLAAFNAARRGREVAVRKVLGASPWRVTRLITLQFLRPVMIASVLAWPVSYLALRTMQARFDDAAPVAPWQYLAVTVAILALAGLVVGSFVFATANVRPGQALRYE